MSKIITAVICAVLFVTLSSCMVFLRGPHDNGGSKNKGGDNTISTDSKDGGSVKEK